MSRTSFVKIEACKRTLHRGDPVVLLESAKWPGCNPDCTAASRFQHEEPCKRYYYVEKLYDNYILLKGRGTNFMRGIPYVDYVRYGRRVL